jgi:hypothetical protein
MCDILDMLIMTGANGRLGRVLAKTLDERGMIRAGGVRTRNTFTATTRRSSHDPSHPRDHRARRPHPRASTGG